jgi:hypothetical protein
LGEGVVVLPRKVILVRAAVEVGLRKHFVLAYRWKNIYGNSEGE